MYFIEQIVKLFCNKKKSKNVYTEQQIEACEHLFVPIDSSREYLSCIKCGKLIKNPHKTKNNKS